MKGKYITPNCSKSEETTTNVIKGLIVTAKAECTEESKASA